jgi:hypothetical protein
MVTSYALTVASVFARLYGVALVAHVVGNWAQPDVPSLVGLLNLGVGIAGLALIWWPRRPLLLVASVLTVGSVLAEMPFTGNHWVVAALAGLAILVTRADPGHYVPALRWILVVFYGFAAFAKLNSGFFDPSVSCAVFYANQSLGGLGLGPLPEGSPLTTLVVWATAGVELLIVPLLLMRPTRYAGIVLATAFHVLISFDLNQHFYDFTTILIALLVCFLPGEAVAELRERVGPWVRPLRLGWLVMGPLLVLLAVLPATRATVAVLTRLAFVLWIPLSLIWLWGVVRAWQPEGPLGWNPGFLGGVVVVVAVLNGLTPYTETKTAYGFNMYANLVTAQGHSNHFVIRNTIPLRAGYDRPVEIVDSSDPGLNLYRDLGYLIPYPQFQRYLVGRDATVDFRRDGEEFSEVASSEIANTGPWWWRFMPLRALDQRDPPRCQDVFLPTL